tara:strand:- start:309 stop:536 length:228 start_codon:yes stop_codon:yes gene_type:complete
MEKVAMIKVVKLMFKKINWLAWLVLVVLWNYGFPQATPFQDVIVAVILSILFIIIQMLQSRYLKKSSSRSKFVKK